ncbi:hypothetical protein KO02_00230 [Sphingobacterium sp. ML3W]|uniref:hypothetical protein n=1 Tax=Sphingobacterium sp. ML3W TaxID=1538644 RepID=UPI0004F59B78|nr:hypothetical protein [Sphingobacterium sp. ML3W]AIM35265.1 hypothetical protein KO02_00230 [Sphingobacterium sp. ML3W]
MYKLINKVTFNVLVLLAMVNSSCRQKANGMTEEKILVLEKQVKHYDQEPGYFIMFNYYFCNIEVFVNDIPIYKNYGAESSTSFYPLDLNEYILKSGEQKVTVRLLPEEGNTLSKEASMKLKIARIANLKTYKNFEAEKKVLVEYETPIVLREGETDIAYGGNFQYAGLPIFEKTFTFQADVPYSVQGWENSKVLNNTGQDLMQIEKEVVEFYQQVKYIYEKRDKESFSILMEPRLIEIAQSHYYIQNDFKKIFDGVNQMFANENKVHSIGNYKLKFYADGRIVTLEPIDSVNIKLDRVLRFETSVFDDYLKREVKGTAGFRMLLHKPKGSNNFEIIR